MEVSEPRCPRSIRLTKNINNRLIAVCDHLGVTPTSYLIAAVGKSITLDEQVFITQKHSSDMVDIASNIRDSVSPEVLSLMKAFDEPDVKEFFAARQQKQQNLI